MPLPMPEQDSISQSSSYEIDYRIIEARFGNGQYQRAKDGINNIAQRWSIAWENLTDAQRDNVVATFNTSAGIDYFVWQPPGSASDLQFLQTGPLALIERSGNITGISVEVEQVFNSRINVIVSMDLMTVSVTANDPNIIAVP